MYRQLMSVSQPIYQLRQIALLPCTHITDILREIWKSDISSTSISPHLTCNCALVTRVSEMELFLPYFTCQIEIIFVHIACHWHEFIDQFSQKSALVSVLGNFLVKSKCLYLFGKLLINQKWQKKGVYGREN